MDAGRAEWLKEELTGCKKSRMVEERDDWMKEEQNDDRRARWMNEEMIKRADWMTFPLIPSKILLSQTLPEIRIICILAYPTPPRVFFSFAVFHFLS